jgi:predicted site-specific integrase-resolvase
MTEELERELARCGAGQAARLIGISVPTLHAWRKAGKIEARQTPAGKYVYDVRPWVQKAGKVAS